MADDSKRGILLAAMAEARDPGLPAFDHVTEDDGLATFRDADGRAVGFMNLSDYRAMMSEGRLG